jgi:hypothetical protein
VLLRQATLDGIVAGEIDLAFRRWERPRVKVGTRLRTSHGLVEVLRVEAVKLDAITAADAKRAGFASAAEVIAMLEAREHGTAYRIGLRHAGDDPRIALRDDDALDAAALAEIRERLARFDRASRSGAWTRAILRAIADKPATLAARLAAKLGHDTAPFKRNVRKLKELGLTESLEVGYRLSPRGAKVLAAIESAADERA